MRGEGAEQSRVRGYRRQDASEDTGQTSRQAGTRRMRGSSAALEAGLNHGGEKGSVPALKAVINHGFARGARRCCRKDLITVEGRPRQCLRQSSIAAAERRRGAWRQGSIAALEGSSTNKVGFGGADQRRRWGRGAWRVSGWTAGTESSTAPPRCLVAKFRAGGSGKRRQRGKERRTRGRTTVPAVARYRSHVNLGPFLI